MRYVDIDSLQLPNGWLERAETAADAVRDGADPNDHAQVWRALKGALANLLAEKCWYCETHIGRSDNAVDHFRPKKRVANTNHQHDGYRWLAFDRTNFRYACTFCNSIRIDTENGTRGGKADLFPLQDEGKRCYGPEDGDPCDIEDPILLDPCDIDDWELLGVKEENGNPCPASNETKNISRVETSIKIYHLDFKKTCDERHRVCISFLQNVRLAKSLFPKSRDDAAARQQFKNVKKQIERATKRDASFSGEMIFLLKGHRSEDHPWITNLLTV